MDRRVVFTSWQSVGCTFMDWSLHWLAGNQYYRHAEKGLIPLVSDPLGEINAHLHRRNHPVGHDKCQWYLGQLAHETGLLSMYPHAEHLDVICERLGLELDNIQDPDCYRLIDKERQQDYQRMLDLCESQGWRLVFIDSDPRALGYFWTIRDIDRYYARPGAPRDAEEKLQEFHEVFFQQSIDTWSNAGLTNVWDQRERMALDLRPFNQNNFFTPELGYNHLWFSSQTLWCDAETVMREIMVDLNVPIVPYRLDSWRPIRDRWQKIQSDSARFWHDLPHILECIVRGWDWRLPRLTLTQEAIVQHCMIYQHGLNFRTWQLERFPDNTKKLHALLEPNIHPI